MPPPRPSPSANSPARSSLKASAQPFYPADSPSGPPEPSNRYGSSHGINAVPAAPSAQAVQSRQGNAYTHFISLPLAIRSGHVDKLTSFLRDEDNRLQSFGIDKSILAKPETIHLTVLMLKLDNEDRIDEASHVLQSISTQLNETLENQPIFIQLRGLKCMNDLAPDVARVVYAPVLPVGGEGRLALACKIIIDAFVKEGLALQSDVREKLKFHVTTMNVRFRESKKPNDSFDARLIFEEHREEEWGEYVIPKVHLSQRYKFDDESGYYHCCSSIPLPAEMQAE